MVIPRFLSLAIAERRAATELPFEWLSLHQRQAALGDLLAKRGSKVSWIAALLESPPGIQRAAQDAADALAACERIGKELLSAAVQSEDLILYARLGNAGSLELNSFMCFPIVEGGEPTREWLTASDFSALTQEPSLLSADGERSRIGELFVEAVAFEKWLSDQRTELASPMVRGPRGRPEGSGEKANALITFLKTKFGDHLQRGRRAYRNIADEYLVELLRIVQPTSTNRKKQLDAVAKAVERAFKTEEKKRIEAERTIVGRLHRTQQEIYGTNKTDKTTIGQ